MLLEPLPCWQNLAPEFYRPRIAERVEAIEAEARTGRSQRGCEPLAAQKRWEKPTPYIPPSW